MAGVSVVTLVALLTLGTFGNHASAPSESPHKSYAPCFRPNIRKCDLTSLVVCQRQSKHPQLQPLHLQLLSGDIWFAEQP